MRALGLALLATAPAAAQEAPFEPGREVFADSDACKAHLAGLASAAGREGYAAVEGPYEVAASDVRIHMVVAEGSGHRITESRCLAERLSSRSWSHHMSEAEATFTVESVARSAQWLKKGHAEQE